jgi:hypothetical protein
MRASMGNQQLLLPKAGGFNYDYYDPGQANQPK